MTLTQMTLDAACLAIVDCEHKTSPLDPTGEYFAVGTPAMRGNRIDFEQARRISEPTFREWTRRLAPREGDLLFAREAPVGPLVRIPRELNVAPGQRTVLLRPDPEKVDSLYLYYLLTSARQQARLAEKAEGSTVPHLNVADVRSFLMPPLPSLKEQQVVAAMLSTLDDKIESNRRAVGLIEELLMLEFQRVISGGEVVEAPLSELVSIVKGVSYKSVDLRPSRISLVTLKSFDRTGGYKANGLKPYTGPYKSQQVIKPGELVIAQTDLTQGAEVVGRAVRVPADPSADTLVASLDLVIVRPLADMTPEYLQGVVTDEAFREYCRSRTSGTTVLHLASNAIPSYDAPLVPMLVQLEYSEFARPLIQRADSLNRESEKLVRSRDELLPELLSGRVGFLEFVESVA